MEVSSFVILPFWVNIFPLIGGVHCIEVSALLRYPLMEVPLHTQSGVISVSIVLILLVFLPGNKEQFLFIEHI